MSALKRLTVARPRPAVRNRIRQFCELMQAIRALPPADDDWRDEVPAYPLPARRLIPADNNIFPF